LGCTRLANHENHVAFIEFRIAQLAELRRLTRAVFDDARLHPVAQLGARDEAVAIQVGLAADAPGESGREHAASRNRLPSPSSSKEAAHLLRRFRRQWLGNSTVARAEDRPREAAVEREQRM